MPASGANESCGDLVFDCGDLAGVIDGVTYKGSVRFGDGAQSGARVASVALAEAFSRLDARLSPQDLVAEASREFDALVRAQADRDLGPWDRLGCVFALLNRVRDEVVWVGDCQVRVEFPDRLLVPETGKRIDDVVVLARCAVLEAFDAAGQDWPAGADPGREVISGILRVQSALGNTEGEFGFGVVDGRQVPARFVGSCDAASALRVVLATDGYPLLAPSGVCSWESAEEYLAWALRKDPECRSILAGTKGVPQGWVSFDDRAWAELVRSVD